MTTNQLFFAVATLNMTMFIAGLGFLKYYIDAKIDPVADDVRRLMYWTRSSTKAKSRP